MLFFVVLHAPGRDAIKTKAFAKTSSFFSGSIWQRKLIEDSISVEQMLHRDVAIAKLGTPIFAPEVFLLLMADKFTVDL
jgi:hypothetical protein